MPTSSGQAVAAIVSARGLRQISDASAIDAVIDKVLAANPGAVADHRAGKPALGNSSSARSSRRRAARRTRRRPGCLRERLGRPAQAALTCSSLVVSPSAPLVVWVPPHPRSVGDLPGARGPADNVAGTRHGAADRDDGRRRDDRRGRDARRCAAAR